MTDAHTEGEGYNKIVKMFLGAQAAIETLLSQWPKACLENKGHRLLNTCPGFGCVLQPLAWGTFTDRVRNGEFPRQL